MLEFPVGSLREQSGFVGIFDDNINEALEYFIVELSFSNEVSRPELVTIGNDVIRLDIVDDDGECMCVHHILLFNYQNKPRKQDCMCMYI